MWILEKSSFESPSIIYDCGYLTIGDTLVFSSDWLTIHKKDSLNSCFSNFFQIKNDTLEISLGCISSLFQIIKLNAQNLIIESSRIHSNIIFPYQSATGERTKYTITFKKIKKAQLPTKNWH